MDPVILKGRQVRREDGAAARRERAVSEGRQPHVRALEENGVVRAIEVRCACGDVVTVELETSAPARGAQE